MALVDILERGYFPKELPNPFVTSSFATAVTMPGVTLPPQFNPSRRGLSRRDYLTKPVKYSHARGGLFRRPLSVPNPLSYFLLSREIHDNWSALQPFVGGTTLSSTNPVFAVNGRAIQSAHPQAMRPVLAVQTRVNNRFILTTDITRFYQSVYTHSIPWALHTKAFAKSNRGTAYLGNRLDLLVRNGQDGQTGGIPIGPDTSLVIGEILMQRCDSELIAAIPSLRGHRLIDDYELGFKNRTDAENAYHVLEEILTRYELSLNPRKTKVEELPCALEEPWVVPLRSFVFRPGQQPQHFDLLRYFDLAFELNRNRPGEAVLQFAVARLRTLTVEPENWPLFQQLLLGCVVPEPAVLSFVLQAINDRVNRGAAPALDEIGEAANTLIIEHSGLAHSSEVAWSLWACLALGIRVSRQAVSAISRCDDSVVALLALHCESEGLLEEALDKTLWNSYMNTQALYEDHWLLSYEANVKGWLPSHGGGDHVGTDPNFGFLKRAAVSFYDTTRAVRVAPTAPVPVPRPVTGPIVGGGGGYP